MVRSSEMGNSPNLLREMSTPELKPETPRTSRYTHDADETPVYPWVYASHMATMETELESALNAAREHIEKAPHSLACSSRYHNPSTRGWHKCDCWKADALAQIDKV